MGAQMSRFPPYHPLGTDEIRVVAFDDQEKTSPTIHLKLLHILRPSTTGSSWPPYHALSWTWGQGKRDRQIMLDGLPFYITQSLHDALHYLRSDASFRSPSSLFLLWIDLICINQLDRDEKSIQVVRMRETYKDACKVIVWLGDYAERREASGEVASFLSDNLPPIPDGHMYVKPPEFLLKPRNAVVLRTLCQDILRRPWWWRMWVIQEVAFARSIVVICDTHHFSWEHLVYMDLWIRMLNINMLNPESAELDDYTPYLPNINFKSMYRHKHVFGGNMDMPILGLLQNATSCLVTDPRDMIYSLLGLATDIKSYHHPIPSSRKKKKRWAWEPCGYGARNRPRNAQCRIPNPDIELLVDYEKRSVEQVYIDFAKIYIRTHEKTPLDVITFSRFNPTPKYLLPSWVPDWSNLRDAPNLRDTACYSLTTLPVMSPERAVAIPPYTYCASGSRSQQVQITPDNHLCVDGIHFDDVTHVGKPWEGGDSEKMSRVLQDWMDLALGDQSQRASDPYPCSSQTLLEVLSRTITVDTSLSGSRFAPGEGSQLQKMLASTSPLGPKERPAMSDAWRAVELRILRRRFFITSKGFFGLGPRNAKPGDAVFILYGCSVPVILRRSREFWTFIGEAFVAGIMDGEVIQAHTADKAKPDHGREDGSSSLLKGTEESIEIW